MAAIKYERDRAANTLLPNYNTYGRYDIPSYYESYWQSPEERFYTGNLPEDISSRPTAGFSDFIRFLTSSFQRYL